MHECWEHPSPNPNSWKPGNKCLITYTPRQAQSPHSHDSKNASISVEAAVRGELTCRGGAFALVTHGPSLLLQPHEDQNRHAGTNDSASKFTNSGLLQRAMRIQHEHAVCMISTCCAESLPSDYDTIQLACWAVESFVSEPLHDQESTPKVLLRHEATAQTAEQRWALVLFVSRAWLKVMKAIEAAAAATSKLAKATASLRPPCSSMFVPGKAAALLTLSKAAS